MWSKDTQQDLRQIPMCALSVGSRATLSTTALTKGWVMHSFIKMSKHFIFQITRPVLYVLYIKRNECVGFEEVIVRFSMLILIYKGFCLAGHRAAQQDQAADRYPPQFSYCGRRAQFPGCNANSQWKVCRANHWCVSWAFCVSTTQDTRGENDYKSVVVAFICRILLILAATFYEYTLLHTLIHTLEMSDIFPTLLCLVWDTSLYGVLLE